MSNSTVKVSESTNVSADGISKEISEIFPHLIEEVGDWPINKLTADRNSFVAELEANTFDSLTRKSPTFLKDLLEKTIYQEKLRIKETPWRIDPPNDRVFWKRVRAKLESGGNANNKDEKEAVLEALKMTIHRYADEIVGTFHVRTYHLIRKILTSLFKRLLNKGIGFFGWWGPKNVVLDKLKIYGPIEQIRNIATKGTVVIVPTHSSNLDSVLIGYTTDYKLGLPSAAYGAGLNLYNFGPAAYFMNRLGAYRVDRRKKNAIYLTTLANMSKLSILKKTNSLFFPGGTRSRSGELEDKLKLGLLSTVIEAQRINIEEGKDEKIFVVPLVLSYHFVLEAKSLVEDFLKKTGKERYVNARNELTSVRSWSKFLYQFLTKSSDITLSFGNPIDCFGNFIDFDGNSLDDRGNKLNLADYFMAGGIVTANHQRESEYTRLLGLKIVERYKAENVILSSHLVSYVAFQLLKVMNSNLDLFDILNLPEEEYYYSREQFILQAAEVIQFLKTRAINGELKLPEEFSESPENVVMHGLANSGTYHSHMPLKIDKKNGDFFSQDFRLLYFYNNRLASYQFDHLIEWNKRPVIYQVD